MNTSEIVIGAGSPHGDDQAGWIVVDKLQDLLGNERRLEKVKAPVDLIDWLAEFDSVHIVDAVVGLAGGFKRLDFGNPAERKALQKFPATSTHSLGVYKTLELAESLGESVDHVTIWLVAASEFGPMTEMTQAAAKHSQDCAIEIQRELACA